MLAPSLPSQSHASFPRLTNTWQESLDPSWEGAPFQFINLIFSFYDLFLHFRHGIPLLLAALLGLCCMHLVQFLPDLVVAILLCVTQLTFTTKTTNLAKTQVKTTQKIFQQWYFLRESWLGQRFSPATVREWSGTYMTVRGSKSYSRCREVITIKEWETKSENTPRRNHQQKRLKSTKCNLSLTHNQRSTQRNWAMNRWTKSGCLN